MNYFKVKCPYCHWIGMSNECNGGQPIADTGDYDDLTCPFCDTEIEDADDELTTLTKEEIIKDLRKKLSDICKKNIDLYYEIMFLQMEIDAKNNQHNPNQKPKQEKPKPQNPQKNHNDEHEDDLLDPLNPLSPINPASPLNPFSPLNL